MTPTRATLLLVAVVGLSLLAHGILLTGKWLHPVPPQAPIASDLAVVAFVIEERIEPPPPEPEPEPTPPPPEVPILAAEQSPEPSVPASPPTPEPTPTPTPSPTPRPTAAPTPAPRPKATAAPAAVTAASPRPATRTTTIARPDYARNPPPRYPEIARRNGWEGSTLVRAHVNADGQVTRVSLHRTSGYGVLDQAALQAVRGWKFIPRQENGIRRDSEVEVPVNFNLRGR